MPPRFLEIDLAIKGVLFVAKEGEELRHPAYALVRSIRAAIACSRNLSLESPEGKFALMGLGIAARRVGELVNPHPASGHVEVAFFLHDQLAHALVDELAVCTLIDQVDGDQNQRLVRGGDAPR